MSASRIDRLAARRSGAADERGGPAGGLAEGELGGRGDLVGDGPDGRAHHPAVGIGRAAQVLERGDPGHADRDVDDAPAPRPAERVGHDDRQVDAEPLADGRPDPAGRGVGVDRQEGHDVEPLAGPTLLASTPPLAQTKPWAVSVMITPLRHPDDPARLAQDDLDLARVAVPALGEGDRLGARLDRRSGRRSRPRPSTRSSG